MGERIQTNAHDAPDVQFAQCDRALSMNRLFYGESSLVRADWKALNNLWLMSSTWTSGRTST